MVRGPVQQCSAHHRQLLSLRSAHLDVSAVSTRTARQWSFSWYSEYGACSTRAAALNCGHRCRPMRGGEQASDTGDSAALSTACSISVMSTFSSGGGAAGRSFIPVSRGPSECWAILGRAELESTLTRHPGPITIAPAYSLVVDLFIAVGLSACPSRSSLWLLLYIQHPQMWVCCRRWALFLLCIRRPH